jgi:hypothetical protein
MIPAERYKQKSAFSEFYFIVNLELNRRVDRIALTIDKLVRISGEEHGIPFFRIVRYGGVSAKRYFVVAQDSDVHVVRTPYEILPGFDFVIMPLRRPFYANKPSAYRLCRLMVDRKFGRFVFAEKVRLRGFFYAVRTCGVPTVVIHVSLRTTYKQIHQLLVFVRTRQAQKAAPAASRMTVLYPFAAIDTPLKNRAAVRSEKRIRRKPGTPVFSQHMLRRFLKSMPGEEQSHFRNPNDVPRRQYAKFTLF